MYLTSVVDPEFKGGKRVIYETTTTVGKKLNILPQFRELMWYFINANFVSLFCDVLL